MTAIETSERPDVVNPGVVTELHALADEGEGETQEQELPEEEGGEDEGAADADVDEESEQSFPASDPPSR